jgi:hypothetical protein
MSASGGALGQLREFLRRHRNVCPVFVDKYQPSIVEEKPGCAEDR